MFDNGSAADLCVLIREKNCWLFNQSHVSHFTVAGLVLPDAFDRTNSLKAERATAEAVSEDFSSF